MLTITQKLLKLKKILDHDHKNKYITTQEFNRFTAENLETKADIDDFVKEKDFDKKLKISNKKFTSNKTKHVEAEKKLTDLIKKLHKYQKKDMIFWVECILQVTMVIRIF